VVIYTQVGYSSINNNNNNNQDYIYGPVMTQSHCVSSPRLLDECRQLAANPHIKPKNLGCESAGRLLSSIFTIIICYYYSAGKLILISPSCRGWKAESIRHCSKGVQPMPKTVYRSGLRDKHKHPPSDMLTAKPLRPV